MQGYAERWLQKLPCKAVSYKVSIKGNVEQLLLNISLLAIQNPHYHKTTTRKKDEFYVRI